MNLSKYFNDVQKNTCSFINGNERKIKNPPVYGVGFKNHKRL